MVRRRMAARARASARRREGVAVHLHILGICGTFMGGLAAIAATAGHRVTGCDANVYPPMSTQLESLGIALTEGFDPSQLEGVAKGADAFVIGNVISRGNPLIEAILDAGLPYASGPQWLYENVLNGKWVLAVAGTHGKTTTASMLAWIWRDAGLAGIPIGSVTAQFQRVGVAGGAFFVIEVSVRHRVWQALGSSFRRAPRSSATSNTEHLP
jgi:UDP-N-acetylmuramate: L-alanyl-gamma-D-glutamyl-meso-diaminopimelate ligase